MLLERKTRFWPHNAQDSGNTVLLLHPDMENHVQTPRPGKYAALIYSHILVILVTFSPTVNASCTPPTLVPPERCVTSVSRAPCALPTSVLGSSHVCCPPGRFLKLGTTVQSSLIPQNHFGCSVVTADIHHTVTRSSLQNSLPTCHTFGSDSQFWEHHQYVSAEPQMKLPFPPTQGLLYSHPTGGH